MGVLCNIYCIPSEPDYVSWDSALRKFAEKKVVRGPFRAGSPFRDVGGEPAVLWPENDITSDTLEAIVGGLPHRDFESFERALEYVGAELPRMITMDSPCSAFQIYPDGREFSAALALYRFKEPVEFRIGVPDDLSDLSDLIAEIPELADGPTEPKWQGVVSELIWLHGKCVMPEEEFFGTQLHQLLEELWPSHLLLFDEFL